MQCSWCRRFFTQPFLCPHGRLHSSCFFFDKLSEEERDKLLNDEKWWWRIVDLVRWTENNGVIKKCTRCGALNPNPEKLTCWQCDHNIYDQCPNCGLPTLHFDLDINLWRCSNAKCYGKKFTFEKERARYKQYKRAEEYAPQGVANNKCPECGHNLRFDSAMLLWRCPNPRCRRIYTYEELCKARRGKPGSYPSGFQSRDTYTSKYYDERRIPYTPPRRKSRKIPKIIGITLASILAIVIVIIAAPFSPPARTKEALSIRETLCGNANNVEIFYNEQPPYAKTSFGERIHLTNSKNAKDPTWQQLVSFITTDKTDSKDYSLFSFPCGAFAEEVHNNAEALGIRAAWVVVDFQDGGELHALNAFHTTDKGIVFVDCTSSYRADIVYPMIYDTATGESREYKPERLPTYDTIAYVVIGKEYGQITLDRAELSSYDFYEDYMQDWVNFETRVDQYNERVAEYSRKVAEYEGRASEYISMLGGRTVIYDESEYRKLKKMYDELEDERMELEAEKMELEEILDSLEFQREILGEYSWKPLGTISHIEIYW